MFMGYYMRFIFIVLILFMMSCNELHPNQNKFDFDDPNVPELKITEVCLEGIVYYVGYYIDRNGVISGGPMTPKFVQDNLFPIRCMNNIK